MKKKDYEKALAATAQELSILAKVHSRVSGIRLALFLTAVGFVAIAISEKLPLLHLAGGAAFLVFVAFVVQHLRIEKTQRYQSARKTALTRTLARFGDDWRGFSDQGAEFLSERFPQGKDLDIFGKNSVFQYLCTAHTIYGRKKLANSLTNLKPDKAEIEKRQAAVRELGGKKDFALHVEALGLITTDGKQKPDALSKFVQLAKEDQKKTALPLILYTWILPILTLTFLTFALLNVNRDLNITIFMACFMLSLASVFLGHGRNGKVLKPVEDFAEQIGAYTEILKAIETEPFEDQYLCALQAGLNKNGGATKALRQLESLCQSVKGRRNAFGFILLNGLFLWDFYLTERFLAWRQQYGREVELWLDSIGELEMLLSLSVPCKVKDQYCFPQILDSKTPKIHFTNIRHPLLSEERAVGNDLDLCAGTFVITGSNMSGKTTFLRSVGVNLLLAYAGAAVTAASFSAHEAALFTSMRIEDSVTDGISAFYAELLRLREIVNYRKKDFPMVILIDEIFKGTNSGDRISGARETVKRLSGNQVITLFTTHDFELCALEQDQEVRGLNFHFEERYEGDQILFDYKIRPGQCKTSNAQYLLKMTGIL